MNEIHNAKLGISPQHVSMLSLFLMWFHLGFLVVVAKLLPLLFPLEEWHDLITRPRNVIYGHSIYGKEVPQGMLRNIFDPFQRLGHEEVYIFFFISGCRESDGLCA